VSDATVPSTKTPAGSGLKHRQRGSGSSSVVSTPATGRAVVAKPGGDGAATPRRRGNEEFGEMLLTVPWPQFWERIHWVVEQRMRRGL
jgi:hypothetical protein